MSTRVCVYVPNIYNGPGHNPLPRAKRGEWIDVASVPYAEDLVKAGLVGYTDVELMQQGEAPVDIPAEELINEPATGTTTHLVKGTKPQRGKRG